LSLLDAFIVRNEFEKAKQVLEEAERYHSEEPELAKRRRILGQVFGDTENNTQPLTAPEPPPEPVDLDRTADLPNLPPQVAGRVIMLKTLLARIADRSQYWS
ncbi:MAG: hypothetical protein HRT45_15030, partial [Bdellovibrionales bacterium]|nr:hypothetical protein [Bdellovibrionales bacterium]